MKHQPTVEILGDGALPDIEPHVGETGPVGVDVRMTHQGAFWVRARIKIGLDWMGELEPGPDKRHIHRPLMGTPIQRRDLDGIDVGMVVRVCPEHLRALADDLICPMGHACRSWMVRVNRRIEFDAEEFRPL